MRRVQKPSVIRHLTLTPGAGPCDGQAADRDTLLKTFFDAAGPKERQAAIAAIVAASPDPLDIERGLRRGRVYPSDVKKGWREFANTGLDGKVRSYH